LCDDLQGRGKEETLCAGNLPLAGESWRRYCKGQGKKKKSGVAEPNLSEGRGLKGPRDVPRGRRGNSPSLVEKGENGTELSSGKGIKPTEGGWGDLPLLRGGEPEGRKGWFWDDGKQRNRSSFIFAPSHGGKKLGNIIRKA